jgi:molybdate transport system substrate-binding protein
MRSGSCSFIGYVVRTIVVVWGVALFPTTARADSLMIFAAASTVKAMEELSARYATLGHGEIRVSLASSGTLAKQIQEGAPADAFLSANTDWMDFLAERNLIDVASRTNLFANELVMAVPADSNLNLTIADRFPLSEALKDGHLAIADPDHVPAGIYAVRALKNMRVWQDVAAVAVRTVDVRAALMLVVRGEVEAGVLYASDAMLEPRVRIIDTFPATSHPPIVYPFALVADSDNPQAAHFSAFVRSAEAREIFVKHGFIQLPQPTPGESP